jgi:hypothetical protein
MVGLLASYWITIPPPFPGWPLRLWISILPRLDQA